MAVRDVISKMTHLLCGLNKKRPFTVEMGFVQCTCMIQSRLVSFTNGSEQLINYYDLCIQAANRLQFQRILLLSI